MPLRNDEGTPVDPVPFLVATSTAFAALYSFVPGYLLSVGVGLADALGATTAAFTATVGVAYHHFVWRARPSHREILPVAVRFRRIVYAVLVALVVMLLLLPVVLR